MASEHPPTAAADQKIAALTRSYRRILESYGEIEALSERERALLDQRESIGCLNELLVQKKEILERIRVEEESVTVAKEWWKNARRSLPRAGCEELLSLLDAISRKVERAIALEAECRVRLDQALAWGSNQPLAQPSPMALRAYGQVSTKGSRR